MDWLMIVGGYLFGSIPTGYLLCKYIRGIDIRLYGSRNIGSTNVKRVCGNKLGRLVLLLDILKAAIPVFVSKYVTSGEFVIISTGIAAIAGHNWTVWLKFRGGKGIAATFGTLVAIHFPVALTAAAVWYLLERATRYVSVASIVSIGLTPFWMWIWNMPSIYIKMSFIISLLSVITHRANIRRLMEGREYKADEKLNIKGDD